MDTSERNDAVPAPGVPLQDVSNAAANNVATVSVKRGRGRPRKSGTSSAKSTPDPSGPKRPRGRPRKSEGLAENAGSKLNQPTSGPRVLFKLRFAAYADHPEESKNVSVAINASTVVVFDGIRDALERAEKERSEWSVLSVKCFDDAFDELVEVRGDDGLENLRKYEVHLQRENAVQEEDVENGGVEWVETDG